VCGHFKALFVRLFHDNANLIHGERRMLPVRIDFADLRSIDRQLEACIIMATIINTAMISPVASDNPLL
jgi:hypothetical protein